MDKFWVSCIIFEEGDRSPWLCACCDCQLSIDEAMKVAQSYVDNYGVIDLWIDKYDKDNNKTVVFHKTFIDVLGYQQKEKIYNDGCENW